MKYRELKTGSAVIGFFGLIGWIVAILFLINLLRANRDYVKVNATITQLYDQGCQFTYDYDGVNYVRNEYTSISSSYKPGKTIKIYIRPDDPLSYKMSDSYSLGIMIGIIFGAVFSLIAVLSYPKKHKTNSNWPYVVANVCGVHPNLNCLINGEHPFKVVCKYYNPQTAQEMRFYSKNCLDDPGDVYMPNEEIKVYYKGAAMKRYKVDLSKFYKCGMR